MKNSIAELIQKNYISIAREATCLTLVDAMQHAHASLALVFDDDSIVGVVTTQDILAHYLQSHDCNTLTVGHLPSSAPLLIPDSTDPATAYALFRQYDVRHIVVTDDEGTPLGPINEQSLLAHLPNEVLLQTRTIASLMQRHPLTVEEHTTIHDAFAAIYEGGVDAAIVLSDSKPVGILTEFDLFDEIGQNIPPHQPVSSIMSKPLIGVEPSTCVQDATQQMHTHRVRHLAVLEEGKLVGLLSENDLLRFAASPQAALVHDTITQTPHLLRLHKSGVDEGILIEHLLNRTPGIVFVLDPDTDRIRYINPGVEKLLGLTPEQIRQQSGAVNTMVHPEDRERFSQTVKTLLANEEVATVDIRLYDREHNVHTLRCILGRYSDKDDSRTVVGIASDITELSKSIYEAREAKAKLHEREMRYRTLFEHSPAGIVYADGNGIIRECNAEALKIFGTTHEQLCGFDLLHQLKDKKLLRAIEAVLKQGASEYKGYYRSVASNKLSYLHVNMQGLYTPDGELYGFMALLFDRLKEQQASEASEHYLRIVPVIIVALDRDGNITKINDKGAALLRQDAKNLIGKNWFDVAIPPNERETVRGVFETILHDEADYPEYFENHIMTPDGERLIAWRNLLLQDEEGKPTGILSAGEDITRKREEEGRLRLLGAMYDRIVEGVMICDSETRIIDINRAFSTITGYSRNEVLGKPPSILASGLHSAKFYARIWSQIERTGSWQGEIFNRNKQGKTYPEWLSITAVRNEQGETTHYIGLFSDISELKRSEAKMRHLALHDPLTGLPNRHLLKERIEQTILHARREKKKAALFFIDLDNFKYINDLYGHDVGDRILKMTAKRLKKSLRAEDTLARFGGDEFIALISTINSEKDSVYIAEKIISTLKEPFELDNVFHYLGASVGIAFYPNDAKNATMLISSADTAMYRAKQSGKNRYAFYTSTLSTNLKHRVEMENALKDAIDKEQFVVFYQPQIHAKERSVDGLEALVRWRRDDGSLVPPMEFIPLLEANREIIEASRKIFAMAFRQVKAWVEEGLFEGRVAVNISGVHLEHGDPVTDMREAFETAGLHPRHIEVEVTETVLMHHAAKWQQTLHAFRRMGISIAIDDFGTGYSSLAYLSRFPLSVLKIDKSFVAGLPNDSTSDAIAHSIIALAKSLGIYTLAEGVETPEQARWLKNEECDVLQGYLYAPPMSAANTEVWLRDYTI